MGHLVFPELVVPLGTHPCKVWLPGPEWRPPGPPVSQRPSLAHDGTRGLGHVFKTCCSLSGSRALARSSACFQDPRVPCPFLPSRLHFSWRLPPRISFLPSLQASVILDARPPSLCPRNPVPNAGRRPPSPLTADVHGTYRAIQLFIRLGCARASSRQPARGPAVRSLPVLRAGTTLGGWKSSASTLGALTPRRILQTRRLLPSPRAGRAVKHLPAQRRLCPPRADRTGLNVCPPR